MKKIEGFNTPCNDQGSSNKNRRSIFDVPGVGSAAPESGRRSSEKSNFFKKAILEASGVIQPNEEVLRINHEEKEAAIERRDEKIIRKLARKDANSRIKNDFNQTKKNDRRKLGLAVAEFFFGLATGNPVATAKGAADTAQAAEQTSKKGQKRQRDVIEGKWREIEAKQLDDGNKS